jgi:hypothetical protein
MNEAFINPFMLACNFQSLYFLIFNALSGTVYCHKLKLRNMLRLLVFGLQGVAREGICIEQPLLVINFDSKLFY